MKALIASLYRALLSALHPRMLWLTVWPFLLACALWGGLLMSYGVDTLLSDLRRGLAGWLPVVELSNLTQWLGLPSPVALVGPIFLALLVVPLIALTALLFCAAVAMPTVLKHLQRTRYASLVPARGGGWFDSLGHSLLVTLVALLIFVVSVPLWFVTPVFAVLSPLLWGWLTYRMMAYDALAEHATRVERRALIRAHRWPLLLMGVAVGLAGTFPLAIFGLGTVIYVLFPVFAPIAIWLYAFIFVFSALWFAHYCLPALAAMRARALPADDGHGGSGGSGTVALDHLE
ncbi:EI24 domain-containing protein [Chitinasiproducens palmae]|nr:EI24 domain-containing protein [Chitinasiproducens palmae]